MDGNQAVVRSWLKVAAVAPLMVGAYVFGAISFGAGWWPIPLLQQARMAAREAISGPLPQPNTAVAYDADGMLVKYPGKRRVECPAQTDHTLVLLGFGQSNAGNSGGQRFPSEYDSRILNYQAGACYVAGSPLLGAEGNGGEFWTPLANRLMATGAYDHIVIAPFSVSGSHLLRWAKTDLAPRLDARLTDIGRRYRITDAVWVQGEADAQRLTSAEEYRDLFGTVIDAVRKKAPAARIFVNVSTKCEGNLPWKDGNGAQQALRAVVKPDANILAGADSDALLTTWDRRDDCHWSGSGSQKVAADLARRIAAAPKR